MSLLEKIKGRRNLTLNHWRYRLLHWCFYEKNVEKVEDSSLPKYLYTHYCPLFHLTNLIAVALPLIVLARTVASVVVGGISIGTSFFAWVNSLNLKGPPRQPTEAELRAQEINRIVNILIEKPRYRRSFEIFWDEFSYRFEYVSREEVEQRFDDMVATINAREEEAERKKARREAFILRMTQIGEVFIKNALRVGGVGALCVGGYGIVAVTPSVFEFICWAPGAIWDVLCSLPWSEIGMWTGIGFSGLVTIAGLSKLGEKASPAVARGVDNLCDGVKAFCIGVSPPFVFCGKMCALPFVGIANGTAKGFEFVKMFYENNCPPITITDENGKALDGSDDPQEEEQESISETYPQGYVAYRTTSVGPS